MHTALEQQLPPLSTVGDVNPLVQENASDTLLLCVNYLSHIEKALAFFNLNLLIDFAIKRLVDVQHLLLGVPQIADQYTEKKLSQCLKQLTTIYDSLLSLTKSKPELLPLLDYADAVITAIRAEIERLPQT